MNVLVIYFECIETFCCEPTIRISFLWKRRVVFCCKLLQFFNCQPLLVTWCKVLIRCLVATDIFSIIALFNIISIIMLHLIIKLQKLPHIKNIILLLILLIKHFKLFETNMTMPMLIHKFENSFYLIEWKFDSQVFDSLRKFVESQWKLMISVECTEARKEVLETFVYLYCN